MGLNTEYDSKRSILTTLGFDQGLYEQNRMGSFLRTTAWKTQSLERISSARMAQNIHVRLLFGEMLDFLTKQCYIHVFVL